MRRLFLLLVLVAAAPTQLRAQEVRSLAIQGVAHVDERDLQRSISTQATKCRSMLLIGFCKISRSSLFIEKHYLEEAELPRDVMRIRLYYWKRGYRETEVDTNIVRPDSNNVRVTFIVKEGRPTLIRTLAINVDSTLIVKKTRDRLTLLRTNDPLDLVVLDSMRVLFQGEIWDQGFGDASVDTTVRVSDSLYLADVALTVTPNRRTTIGRITVNGVKRIDVQTVLNTITFRTGDLYRQSTVLESQRNLYESNLFRLAAIGVPPEPHDSVKAVNIDVTEAPLHDARIGPGLNNVDFLQFQTHYTSYNLFGGARRLDIDATVGNLLAGSLEGRAPFRDIRADTPDSNVAPYIQPTYSTSINLKQPALFGHVADAAAIGAFAHRDINPGVFVDRGFGTQGTFTHLITTRVPASLSYRYEANRVQASDVFFCVNYGVCDGSTIGSLRSHQALSPLTLTGFVDRSDLPFSPTKGYVARVDFEHASALTLSDYRYNRIFVDAAAYGHKSRTKNVYSAHIRLGFVRALTSGADSGVLHPRKRFYAGGANSVRGYGENQLGPRILTIDDSVLVRGATSLPGGTCGASAATVKFCNPNSAKLTTSDFIPQPLGGTSLLEGSIEYRVPLPLGNTIRNWVAAVFLDGGVVGQGNIRGFQSISKIIKGTGAITPGFGVRYESPVGPIRIDIGINPNRAEDLAVVTAVRDSAGVSHIVPLSVTRNWVQGKTLLNRLALHFSIGEAY
jgi:outer membrane protein insertion porin family